MTWFAAEKYCHEREWMFGSFPDGIFQAEFAKQLQLKIGKMKF